MVIDLLNVILSVANVWLIGVVIALLRDRFIQSVKGHDTAESWLMIGIGLCLIASFSLSVFWCFYYGAHLLGGALAADPILHFWTVWNIPVLRLPLFVACVCFLSAFRLALGTRIVVYVMQAALAGLMASIALLLFR